MPADRRQQRRQPTATSPMDRERRIAKIRALMEIILKQRAMQRRIQAGGDEMMGLVPA
jgi:hypothetical protein